VNLADLVGPLGRESFLDDHWATGRLHLSRPEPSLVARLKSIDALASVEALLPRHRQDIRIFGPRSFRSTVSPEAALDFLAAGYNLYITGVEETVPEARPFLAGVARDLGMEPWQLHVEAFAGKAGGVSSRHYDHDVNFQLMLDGEKEWLLEENRNIRNPLQSFHPAGDAQGGWSGLREEAYADDPVMPPTFDPERSRRLRAVAGTTLFLPRGCWHETRSVTDTWSVNLVLRSVTWARAIGKALEVLLHRRPEFRAYVGGPGTGRVLPPAASAHQAETFRGLKQAAAAALDELTMDEAVLSLLAFIGQTYAWRAGAAGRAVVERANGWALAVPELLDQPLPLRDGTISTVRKLCALREPFTWAHLRSLAGDDSDAAGLHALISSLIEAGLVDAQP
jgi:50S ribosomal protein L16 3-hydroxylase